MSSDVDTAKRPLRRDAERNRLRILQAASELFAERGLDVTLDQVAARAGVGVGTVYRRFPNKEVLVDALFEDRIAEVAGFARDALADPDPWAGFVGFMEQACRRHTADRGLQQVIFSMAHGQERVACARDEIAPIVAQLIARAQADGRLRADLGTGDVPVLQLMIGASALYCGGVEPELWRRMLGIVLDGLCAAREEPAALPVGPLSDAQLEQVMRTARVR